MIDFQTIQSSPAICNVGNEILCLIGDTDSGQPFVMFGPWLSVGERMSLEDKIKYINPIELVLASGEITSHVKLFDPEYTEFAREIRDAVENAKRVAPDDTGITLAIKRDALRSIVRCADQGNYMFGVGIEVAPSLFTPNSQPPPSESFLAFNGARVVLMGDKWRSDYEVQIGR